MEGYELCIQAIGELEKRVRLEFDLHYKHCASNSVELTNKLEKLNEFRGAMSDQAVRFEEGIGKRLSALELLKANLDGKFWAFTIAMLIIQFVFQVWPLFKH